MASRCFSWRIGVWLLVASTATQAQAPDRAQVDALKRRAAERIQQLQREAEALASRERTLLDELRRLEVERDLKTEQAAQAARELDDVTRQLDETTARIATLAETAETQRPDLSARLTEMYKLGNAGYVKLLLSVNDVRDLGRAYRFVTALQRLDRGRVIEHERTLVRLKAERVSLEERRTRMMALEAEANRDRAAAEAAAASRDALVKQIDAERDLNAQWIGELQTAEQKLQETIGTLASPGRGGGAAHLPIRPFRGALAWPSSGRLASRFGRQWNARFQTSVIKNGVDIAAPAGGPVVAVHDGTVAYADRFTGFGNLVIVDHGAQSYSLYGNLGTMTVQKGVHVTKEQPVGTVGSGLNSTPALYFELRIDGKPADPVQWLRKR